MEVKIPTIRYMNILEKAELTASIRRNGKFDIMFISKLARTNFCNPFLSLLTVGHRGNNLNLDVSVVI